MPTGTGEHVLNPIVEKLDGSPHPSQRRTSRDLRELMEAEAGPWSDWLRVLGARAMADRSLCIPVELRVQGMIWNDGAPVRHNDGFIAGVIVPSSYPLAMPQVRFMGSIPFSPHVLLPDSGLFDERGLPRELVAFVEAARKRESGWCCFARRWSPLASWDLLLCLWQVSLLITGSQYWGERRTCLNHTALEYFNRLRTQGELPLGNPLPFPRRETAPNQGVNLLNEVQVDDGIEIQEIEGEQNEDVHCSS